MRRSLAKLTKQRPYGAPFGYGFRRVEAVPVVSVSIALRGSGAGRSPVHPTPPLAVHYWRLAGLPLPRPGTTSGRFPKRQWFVCHPLHGLVRYFHLIPPQSCGAPTERCFEIVQTVAHRAKRGLVVPAIGRDGPGRILDRCGGLGERDRRPPRPPRG